MVQFSWCSRDQPKKWVLLKFGDVIHLLKVNNWASQPVYDQWLMTFLFTFLSKTRKSRTLYFSQFLNIITENLRLVKHCIPNIRQDIRYEFLTKQIIVVMHGLVIYLPLPCKQTWHDSIINISSKNTHWKATAEV